MKKVLIIFLVLLMVLGVAACGKNGDTEKETQDPNVETSQQDTPSDAPTEEETESLTENKDSDETDDVTESVATEGPTQNETEEKTEETEEMESAEPKDAIASVGIYEEYNLDTYMSPIWEGKVVHNETVMFVGIDDKASLLYDADRIISVRSYDLRTEYVQGVDYDYVDGKLVLLEGTRIPYVPLETYYSVLDPNYPYLSTMYNGVVTQTMFGDGDTMTKWQVAVTYKHSDEWGGPEVKSYPETYKDFITKLENGEDVTVMFYGDSITTGATSSQSRAPYAPSFPRMFCQYVAKQYGYTVTYVNSYADELLTNGKPSGGQAYADTVYGTRGTITYINTAVGGWSTQGGLDNVQAYVTNYINKYGCDLFVLAFGMNNGSSTAASVTGLMEQIVRRVYKAEPEADVVLVSTMIPNPEAVRNSNDKYFCNGNQYTFEEAMYPLAEKINKNGISCAVAPMTSVSTYIHSQKRYRDTTGNNVNHPSDFLARTYAQVIYQTVFGYENYAEEPVDVPETPTVNVNYNAILNLSGVDTYLDGKSGTTNANYASCIRVETADGGYYMYHVSEGVKTYINAISGSEISYSDKASTVWTYNATLKAMVCNVDGVEVRLVAPEICIHPVILGSESHSREACITCGIEQTESAHSYSEVVSTSADGSVTHETKCTYCGHRLEGSYTVPAGINHYYPLTGITLYNAAGGELLAENGSTFYRSSFANGDGHIFLNGSNATSKIDGSTGKYLVIKYRCASNSSVSFDVCTSDHEGSRTVISKPAALLAGEWEIAVIDLSQFANYTCDSDLKVQIRLTLGSEYFDISYAAIVDSVKEAKSLMADDDKFVIYTDWRASGEMHSADEEDSTEAPGEEETTEKVEEPTLENDAVASVGQYTSFDLDSYMTPIWDGKVVHNETVLFVGEDDTPALLYSPDKIISVRSYDLATEYIEGVDFEIVDGKIRRLEGSRIPYIPTEIYYSVHGDKPYLSTMVNGVVTQTMFGEGATMCKWQIAVTYKHSDTWEGIELESYTDRFAGVIEKLEKGEDVTFHFYGDSITAGGNASSSVGMSPYTPIWAKLLTQYVAKTYGYTIKYVTGLETSTLDKTYGTNGTITYINTAVGGWNTQQGRDNFDEKVKAYEEKYGCDLFILAFGMNNGGNDAAFVCGVLDEIVVKLEACAPDADVLLVSTMLPNPEAVRNSADTFFCNGNQPTFEAAMIPLAEAINNRGTDCALARMTSMTEYLYTIKRFRDTTGNNVNHPSDFVVRLYAQTLFQTVFGYENYEKSVATIENKPTADVNFNAEMTLSGNTVYLDGKNGTANKNDAVCVRFDTTDGGFFMYYIKNFDKLYVNAENGVVNYSNTARSVWVYDEATGAVVSGGASLKLSAPEICYHDVLAGDETHGITACIRCGIEGGAEAHSFTDDTTVNADGSTSYKQTCAICGKDGRSYTIPAGVIYYSGFATYSSPIFYLLNRELINDGATEFTRVTAKTSNHGHELHWVDQNSASHNDYTGNPLDTKGARYLVIRLRASSDDIKPIFRYKLLEGTTVSISIPVVAENEWITYVIDLESASAGKYNALADGSYVMHQFKMFISAGFDQIESAYVDFAYMSLCSDFEQIDSIANAETVRLITVSGNAKEVKSDGTCTGEHSYKETMDGNTYIVSCSVCGTVIDSKTLPDGLNVYSTPHIICEKANGANLINYAEVINNADGVYCRIYGGSAHATQNYNQFSLYANSSASTVTGQYLVIKYRVGENGLGQKKITIYAGTENAGPTTDAEMIELYVGDKSTIEDGEWHIAIINMDTAAGIGKNNDMFKADEDGLFRAKFVSVRPFYTGKAGGDESDYMDIAFSAICDSIDKAEALLGSGSYEYYTISSTPTVVTINNG